MPEEQPLNRIPPVPEQPVNQSPQSPGPQNPVGAVPLQAFSPVEPAPAGQDSVLMQPPTQSAIPGAPFEQEKVKDHLVLAILVIVFASIPLGAVAVVYARKSRTKLKLGDLVGAQRAATLAKRWAIIGLAVGLPIEIILIASGNI